MQRKSYVFIAGGIGITPFRSIIKYLLDSQQKVPIILFYFASSEDEILFRDLLKHAEKELGIQVHYIVEKDKKLALQQYCKQYITDITLPSYYLSGPQAMIESYRALLLEMGVAYENIQEDYFFGYEWEESD